MAANDKNQIFEKVNWNASIPIIFLITITVLGIIKLIIAGDINYLSTINMINSNVFSTFMSTIFVKIYLFVVEEEIKKEKVSGLSMRTIPLTILITIFYGIIAIFDFAIPNVIMATLFLITNIVYVLCYFIVFVSKK